MSPSAGSFARKASGSRRNSKQAAYDEHVVAVCHSRIPACVSILPERTSSRPHVTQPSLARHRGPLTQDVEETMAPVTRELVFA
jgi:hypothetical protein